MTIAITLSECPLIRSYMQLEVILIPHINFFSLHACAWVSACMIHDVMPHNFSHAVNKLNYSCS